MLVFVGWGNFFFVKFSLLRTKRRNKMNKFTADNIDTTLSTIESLILNCEKIQPKLQEGSSQQSLIKNRIKALCIAKSLITGKKHDFTAEEILKSAAPVTSL